MRSVKKPAGSKWVGYVVLPEASKAFEPWLRPLVDAPKGPTIVDRFEDGIGWGSRCDEEAECDKMLEAVRAFWVSRDHLAIELVREAVQEQPGWRGFWNRLIALLLWKAKGA